MRGVVEGIGELRGNTLPETARHPRTVLKVSSLAMLGTCVNMLVPWGHACLLVFARNFLSLCVSHQAALVSDILNSSMRLLFDGLS